MALRTVFKKSRFIASLWANPNPYVFPLTQLIKKQQRSSTGDAMKKEFPKNEQITSSIVRLVSSDGTHRILPTTEALQQARDAGLDLVEVSSESTPPVVRIMNILEVDRQKRIKEKEIAKKSRERQRQEKTKEIRFTYSPRLLYFFITFAFSPRISNHDLEQKVKKINELLDHGTKVHIVVMTPTLADRKMGEEALQYLQTLLESRAKVKQTSNPIQSRLNSSFLK